MATASKINLKVKVPAVRKDDIKGLIAEPLKKYVPAIAAEFYSSKTAIPRTEEFNRLITGDFTQGFSKQTSRLFRIFLSSTFSDFKVERNELYRRVFPAIKQRCAQLGYEFQVVDMRWGVSDTADSDHTADTMCMDEIERCIDLSAGLNFIYLVGNRYGYMYVPLQIEQLEFEKILAVAREEKIANVDLMEKWFQLDQNSLPPKHVYVPITTHFKHFEEQSAEQAQEKKQWQAEEKLLLKALRESVDKAFEKKKLTNEQAAKYFESITQREIQRGTAESNRAKVIGVVRDFTNPYVETPADAKFLDSAKNERVTKSINQLKAFCAKVTSGPQFKRFVIPWKPGGIDIANEQSHQQYMNEFCQYLSSTIMKMVESTYTKMSKQMLSSFHEDLLHHAVFCREKTKFFFGREELLANVHTRIEANRRSASYPIAFIAESGCGKTSFMARLAQDLRTWYPTSAVFIRFLGTSARSTNIELVIRSLCRQLKLVYGSDDDGGEDEDDQSLTFASLVRLFHERLKSISRKRLTVLSRKNTPKPLFILLDAIDQFEDTSKHSFQFDAWLPRYLPRDVHIFVSFIPAVNHFNLKEGFTQFSRNNDAAMFTVPRLRPIDCENIIRDSLQATQRQLTNEQYKYLLTTVEHNPKPLYLKLLIDVARTWTCFRDPSLQTTLALPETIETAVEQFFARLETRYGKEFVQYSLAYLGYGLNGISENELEDCLSINDVVLSEIYAHHDPPIPNVVHVPSLLCQSFLYAINEYISRKRIHDKHILSFYHRKFSEATRKRYDHLRKQCHEHLIEIYSNEEAAYKRTIVLKKRNNMTINDADRLISSQMTNVLNRRKLIALPYHCLEFGTGKDHLLRTLCLFNLKFLACQLQSLGQTVFLDTIRNCLRDRPDWLDLRRLYRAIWSIDDDTVDKKDASLIIAEQVVGFIDDQQTSQMYNTPMNLNTSPDLEKLLLECRQYCSEHTNSFRSLYAGFPQETDALAWSFSPVTHILNVTEFFCLAIIDGVDCDNEDEPNSFISAQTVAVINLQTGKVDKIYLDETFCKLWAGYITKNGSKVYLFGTHSVKIFNSRTGNELSERSLSYDNKSYCNKAYCLTSNEEQLIVANEYRVTILDETDEDAIVRSGRIPVKNASFEVKNTANTNVSLRCVGTNDDFALCLLFDEYNQVLITLWALNEHDEILVMRFAFIYLEVTSNYLFDLPVNNNEMLYLTTAAGNLCVFDLIQIKPNNKVLPITTDESSIVQMQILPNEELFCLVCLVDDTIAVSTNEHITLFDRKNLPSIVRRIPVGKACYDWQITTQEDLRHMLITTASTQQFITIYREDGRGSPDMMPLEIKFRSNVEDIRLIQTTTMIDNDEKKKSYVLIRLADETIQLLNANQMSQASVQPYGLFTQVKNYEIGEKMVAACEHDATHPLVMRPTNKASHTIQSLRNLTNLTIDFITLLDNDQYYVLTTRERLVYIYSVHNLNELLFEYDLNKKSTTRLFAVQTCPSNLILFLYMNQFIALQVKYDSLETRFHLQSEQILAVPSRDVEYSLQMTPNQRFLILQQSLKREDNLALCDLRLYPCSEQFKISVIKEPIAYIKSKFSKNGKVTGFMTYVPSHKRSEIWVAHQGSILHVNLPSTVAEQEVRSNFHSWMRHSLALYSKTTEKYSLSITISSLAVQAPRDAYLASGADDGSIVVWTLGENCSKNVLDSVHADQVTDLKFDIHTDRLFSSSLDRTIAVWSPMFLLHVLRVHMPIERIHLFTVSNILLARGKFWGFDRLLMFHIGSNATPSTAALPQLVTSKQPKQSANIEPAEIASWGLQ